MTSIVQAPKNFVDDPEEAASYKLPLDVDFIFYSDIPTGPRILYAFLVAKASEYAALDGGVSIPMETIGRKLNISYATIWKHVQRLQQLGFLKVEQNKAGHNRYYVSHYWAGNH